MDVQVILSAPIEITLEDGTPIEVSIGEGAAVLAALSDIADELATKVDAGGAAAAAPVQSVAGRQGNVTLDKGDVGLSNVDNTPDTGKPLSTPQAGALNSMALGIIGGADGSNDTLKKVGDRVTGEIGARQAGDAGIIGGADTNNDTLKKVGDRVSNLAKADVGLGNVDNTADASKPVSTAQATAIRSASHPPVIPSGILPTGAVDIILDGLGRPIQGTTKSGRPTFRKAPASGQPDSPVIPSAIFPLAAELTLDGRGRPIRATNATGASLYAKPANPPTFRVPSAIIPAGADPQVVMDGRGRMAKARAYVPPVTDIALPPGLPLAGGLLDGQGNSMPGSVDRRSGGIVGLRGPGHGIAYLTGATPNRQVRVWFAADNRDILISMPGSDPDIFVQDGDRIDYRRTTGGISGDGVYMESESIAPEPMPMGTSRFAYVPLTGQSNACGYGLDVQNVIRAPVRPGRARMFARGPRLQHDAVTTGTGARLGQRSILTLRDLFEVPEATYTYVDQPNGAPSGLYPKETPCSGMGWQLTSPIGLPSTDMLITATLGVGGITLANMSKGKRPYFNLMRSIWSAAVKAAVRNVAFVVPYIPLIQGESDVSMSLAARTAALVQYQNDLDADIKEMATYLSATWTQPTVVLVGAQISSWTVSNITRSEIANAILNLAISQPDKFMCSGAMYGFQFNMPNHLTAIGHDDHGEQIGYIIDRRLAGVTQPQVYCTGTTVDTGTNTVRLHMNVQGSIAIDTSVVSDPGNYGATFAQDGGAGETISGTITVGGADIIVPFSAIPSGTNRRIELGMIGIPLNWGGPTAGPRTCFQDSVTYTTRDGRPGISRACHQTVYF